MSLLFSALYAKVSLLFSALYVKCHYYSVLYMHSVFILSCVICNLLGDQWGGVGPARERSASSTVNVVKLSVPDALLEAAQHDGGAVACGGIVMLRAEKYRNRGGSLNKHGVSTDLHGFKMSVPTLRIKLQPFTQEYISRSNMPRSETLLQL